MDRLLLGSAYRLTVSLLALMVYAAAPYSVAAAPDSQEPAARSAKSQELSEYKRNMTLPEYTDVLPSDLEYRREVEQLRRKVVLGNDRQFSIPSGTVFLPISESSVFKSNGRLTQIVTSSTESAHTVVFSDNDFALLGKSPGRTIVEVHDGSSAPVTLAVEVAKSGGWLGTRLKKLVQFVADRFLVRGEWCGVPAVTSQPISFREIDVSRSVILRTTHPRLIELKHRVVRTSIADPSIAEPFVVDTSKIVLVGKCSGTTTFTIWDEDGNADAIELRVHGTDRDWKEMKGAYDAVPHEAKEEAVESVPPSVPDPAPSSSSETVGRHFITIWSGRNMDVLSVPSNRPE
jgi:Flp pilus assembly secretin CpaC